MAIQAVDDVLDDYHGGCALERPDLVTAVMMFAGNAYQALTIRATALTRSWIAVNRRCCNERSDPQP